MLEDERSGLYYQSAVYVMEYLEEELFSQMPGRDAMTRGCQRERPPFTASWYYGYAYRRKDGVYVIPIGCLKN